MYDEIVAKIEKDIDGERAERSSHYFGIAPGKYGEGDIFLGCTVPYLRKIAKEYKTAPLKDVEHLLCSEVHEFRFVALAILAEQYAKNPDAIKDFYLKYIKFSNNWDLVDAFSWRILGQWCLDHKDERILHELNRSDELWKKRISIVGYQAFYRRGVLGDGLDNIEHILEDKHDLIQKANGWMLREIYWRVDKPIIESFIIDNYKRMPRTTLRYAIERMPEAQRLAYLHGEFHEKN